MSSYENKWDVHADGVRRTLDKAARMGVPSRDEERELLARAKDGDMDAMERLVVPNLLIVYVKYIKKYAAKGVDAMDLMQEAAMGLQRAVRTFDMSVNTRYATYAQWWARAYVAAYFYDKCGMMRMQRQTAIDIGQAKAKCTAAGRPITEDNVRDFFDRSWDLIGKHAYRASAATTSLSMPCHGGRDDGDDLLISDTIIDGELHHDDAICDAITAAQISAYRYKLSPTECKVIEMRFGFLDKEYTLEEVGNELGRTRERARQIQVAAIENIRRFIRIDERNREWRSA